MLYERDFSLTVRPSTKPTNMVVGGRTGGAGWGNGVNGVGNGDGRQLYECDYQHIGLLRYSESKRFDTTIFLVWCWAVTEMGAR